MAEDLTNRADSKPACRSPAADSARSNPFWGCVIVAGFAFAVTCLISVAASFGDAQGPMNRWVSRYGTTAIALEAAVLIGSALLAMTVDRCITAGQLKAIQTQPSAPDSMPKRAGGQPTG